MAKQHGEEAAVILQGLGYKVAKSKKVKDGKRWHFDPLRALESRWPYLKDSGIHGIIERQIEGGNIFTGRYNKQWWRDKTTWYSVPEAIQKRALENENKIWFDVPVAVKCHSIIAGTLYQHLRYQLLLVLADDPACGDAPYYRVNKSALARYFPWSLSTIKRYFKEMCECGLIEEKAGEYTITNSADLVVPESMKSRSSAEMRGGSSTEKGRSSAEIGGSTTEMTGSSADNITHYKPFERHIHKHHSPPAAPIVLSVCADSTNTAKGIGHKEIDIPRFAPTVPVLADSDNYTPVSLEQIRQRITYLQASLIEAERARVAHEVPLLCPTLVSQDFPIEVLRPAFAAITADQIVAAIQADLSKTLREHADNSGWSPKAGELAGLMATEIITGAFLLDRLDWEKVEPMFKKTSDAVWNTYQAIPTLGNHPEATPTERADSLIKQIVISNQDGWPTYGDDTIQFKVSAAVSVRTAAVNFFEEHPDVTTQDVWRTLSDCIEVHKCNTPPKGGFDPLWKSRKGITPKFLFKYWDDIQAEISGAEILLN